MNLKQKNSILLKKKSFFKYKMAAKIDFFVFISSTLNIFI